MSDNLRYDMNLIRGLYHLNAHPRTRTEIECWCGPELSLAITRMVQRRELVESSVDGKLIYSIGPLIREFRPERV